MSESVVVDVSGTAFSLLLYENIRNSYDQEGFLLGEIVTNEKRTITDNDQEVVTIEHIIKVNSILPCPKLGHFFNNAGKINSVKIAELLQGKTDSVVSWYKFKRTSSFKLTLREKIVMKQLAHYFMPAAPEQFTCCLLTSQLGPESGATHIFSQTFIRYFKSAYQPLPMHIVNLKDPCDVYKEPKKSSTLFNNIVKSLKIDTNIPQGYAAIESVEVALDKHIAQVVKKLEKSEEQMHKLEQEVFELRQKLGGAGAGDVGELLDENAQASNDTLNSSTEAPSGESIRRKRSNRKTKEFSVEKEKQTEKIEEVLEKRTLRNSNAKKS